MSVGATNSGPGRSDFRIGIVVGSTRPGRRGDMVASWVDRVAADRSDATFEVVDVAAFGLPLLDELVPAAIGTYQQPHTRAWSRTIAGLDGYVFVTPEYNHSIPAALKNAIDFLYREWHDKAAGLVSYGISGGIRAGEHLRLVLAEVKVACVRRQVTLSLGSDFEITDIAQPGAFAPSDHQQVMLERMFDELISWSGALRVCRQASPAPEPTGNTIEDQPRGR